MKGCSYFAILILLASSNIKGWRFSISRFVLPSTKSHLVSIGDNVAQENRTALLQSKMLDTNQKVFGNEVEHRLKSCQNIGSYHGNQWLEGVCINSLFKTMMKIRLKRANKTESEKQRKRFARNITIPQRHKSTPTVHRYPKEFRTYFRNLFPRFY